MSESPALPAEKKIRPPASANQSLFAKDYLHLTKEAFARAFAASSATKEYFYSIGNCPIRLRFADAALQPIILPALAHLAVRETDKVDLTIDLADGFSAGENLPFPSGTNFSGAEAITWRHEEPEFSLLAQPEGGGSLSLLCAEEKRGFFWAQNAAHLPWYEAGFPLRLMFHQWFRQCGKHLIHAAAVGTRDGAALIVGKGGSGKSTSALACAEAGLFYLGDDYTLAGTEPEPRVWSLYCSAKATPETSRRFPKLAPCIRRHGGDEEKSLLILQRDLFRPISDLPLRAVVWPRVVKRAESRLVPASSATLLLALAPSAILQMPGAGSNELRALADLVRAVPTYILEAGSDMHQLAAAIEKLLSPA